MSDGEQQPAQEPRERILAAAAALLDETSDPQRITVRQIAERAGVGIGLINYHFQSKDNLLNEVVSGLMLAEAARWFAAAADSSLDAQTRLRRLLQETSRIGVQYPGHLQIMLTHEFHQPTFSVPLMIVPLLREIYGGRKTEMELRLIALQMVLPLQVAGLQPDALRLYAGVDLVDARQREDLIDTLIDNLIPQEGN